MARDRASREGARPLRLFVALEVPQAVLELIDAAVGPLREYHPHARWVPPQNRHVTLKFLGTTWPRLVDWVVESIEEVAASTPPFATRVEGLGAFPNERRARVLWAGLHDGTGRLTELAGAVDRALEREFPPEKRAFTPHLTVARFDPPAHVRVPLPGVRSDEFRIDRMVLFRSHLRRPAPLYETLEAFALGG
jgi:RNA 2',3'-cyclic 3'-phosphodiesterase